MIYFVTDNLIPNYIDDVRPYKYPTDKSFYGDALCSLETCYPYYILKNNKCNYDIQLITYKMLNIVDKDDTLIFYLNKNYTDASIISQIECKSVQIVTDTPVIDNIDMYITYDPSVIEKDTTRCWRHVLYPLPIGFIKSKPTWPPTNITCISPDMYTSSKQERSDKYTYVTDSYHNTGDEHILFHLRDPVIKHDSLSINKRMKFPSHKTANRLYQSWYAGVPGIFTPNPAMEYIRKSPYDYLSATTIEELEHNVNRLKNDEELYNHMTSICRSRADENNHDVIYKQWMLILEELI
tara:strand:+ start:457 stop:1341 length:885 start_codon:yes stop_codon:yes gene_type:complete